MALFDIYYYMLIYFIFFYTGFFFLTFAQYRSKFSADPIAKRLPVISLIIPAYNEAKTIKKAVLSVLAQDYPKEKIKIIVVDDGSTDKTSAIAKQLEKRFSNVKLLRKKNGGFKAAAINHGLKHVKTELVGFMDADSYLVKSAFRSMVGYFEEEKTGSVIGTVKVSGLKSILERLQYIEYVISALSKRVFHFVNGNYITPAFALYKTKTLKKIGGFEVNNPSEDVEIALRVLDNGYRIKSSYGSIVYTEAPSTIKGLMSQRVRWARGLIHNTRRYSHMILNPKYGDLGLFTIPTPYITLVLVNMFLGLIFYNMAASAVDYYFYMSAIGFDFTDLLRADFNNIIIDMKTIFFLLLTLVTVAIIALAKRSMRDRKGIGLKDYFIFLFIYPLLLDITLGIATIKYLSGSKQGW